MTTDATTQLTELTHLISEKRAPVAVIGLGYVGLSVAGMLARCGFAVMGVDINMARIAALQAGRSPMEGEEPGFEELITEVTASGRLNVTADYDGVRGARVVIICVDTPVEEETHLPVYKALRGALASLGPVLEPGALVIVESTIAPGTMTTLVIPTLEASTGMQAGEDFYLGHCPERVTPGKLLYNLTHLSRTVGGQTPDVAAAMVTLYTHYVEGDLDTTDLLSAEIVKTAENAFRDVQIAFANELAIICETLGADAFEVRELVNKSPGRNVLMPGAGVGGHCIPKDPWLLIANVRAQYEPLLIPAARAVNNQMPYRMVELTRQGLAAHGVELAGARIAVLGYAFREGTDDDRDSPSQYLIAALEAEGALPVVHDPYVRAYQVPLEAVVSGAQAVVLMVGHAAYRELDLAALLAVVALPVLIDGRHIFTAADARAHGFTYLGVGTPQAKSDHAHSGSDAVLRS
ncbi:MAG: nucleotide sugar dehydrogenase [Chloroflexi bacterium]|nr:nucleotide sugar dehydrogenase [Chloroflexota bacterium]